MLVTKNTTLPQLEFKNINRHVTRSCVIKRTDVEDAINAAVTRHDHQILQVLQLFYPDFVSVTLFYSQDRQFNG